MDFVSDIAGLIAMLLKNIGWDQVVILLFVDIQPIIIGYYFSLTNSSFSLLSLAFKSSQSRPGNCKDEIVASSEGTEGELGKRRERERESDRMRELERERERFL